MPLVQRKTGGVQQIGNPFELDVLFDNPVVAGNAIIVSFGMYHSTGTGFDISDVSAVSTCSDSNSDSYDHLATTPPGGLTFDGTNTLSQLMLFIATAVAGGTTTVKLKLPNPAPGPIDPDWLFFSAIIEEWSDIASASVLDGTAAVNEQDTVTAGGTLATGSVTTGNATDLLYSVAFDSWQNGATLTPDSSFGNQTTFSDSAAETTLQTAVKGVSVTGTYGVTWTDSDSIPGFGFHVLLVALKEGASGTPQVDVSTNSLSMGAVEGGGPVTDPVDVTNGGSGTLNFTATSDQAWLTVTPSSGSAPATLEIKADPAGLPQGTYIGHITVTSV